MRATSCTAVIAALLALSGSAHAQNALGDGRALDRNLQVGSGGKLPGGVRRDPIADQQRLNNAIMNGTATGGRAFRGYSPSAAFDRFGNSLGSDSIYRFQRETAPSGITGLGIRGSDALQYQFSMSGNAPRVDPRVGLGGILQRPSNVTTSASPTALRSTSAYIANTSLRPSAVGVRQDEYGAEYTANASPLTGITWIRTRESPLGAAPTPAPTGTNPTTPSTTPDTQPALQPGMPATNEINPITGLPKPGTATEPGASDSSPTRVYSQIVDRLRTETTRQPTNVVTQVPPTAPGDTPDATAQQPATKPVDASLEAQLDRLRAMMRGEALPTDEPASKKPGTDIAKPATPPQPSGLPGGVNLPPPVVNPSNDPLGLDAPVRKDVLQDMSPELRRSLRLPGDQKLATLSDITPEQAKAGTSTAIYARAMSQGQTYLKEGRYFDAESQFAVASASASGDPMARIGRTHAQLGAGLYLSAASNLRDLLARHPEVVGVKYEQNLLVSTERSREIAKELQENMQNAGSGLQRDSALLMAYLGYQLNDPDMTRAGIDGFSTRLDPQSNRDLAVYSLIRSAWLAE